MSVGGAEKQKIIMQISAVQTDLKRTLDERFALQFKANNSGFFSIMLVSK